MKIGITWKNIYVDNKSQNSNANFKRCQIFECTKERFECKITLKTVVLLSIALGDARVCCMPTRLFMITVIIFRFRLMPKNE